MADQIPDAQGRLASLQYPATGGTQKGTAGGPTPDQIQVVLTSWETNPTTSDYPLYTVPSGKTFFLTDFVVTGSPSSGNPLVVLKYNSLITSGAITSTGSNSVTLASIDLTAINGQPIFVGQRLDIERPSDTNYESVVVTAVTLNASNIVTGFTALFTKTHASTIYVGVPLEVSLINSTKGIEEIGIETQPTAPPGSLVSLNVGAFTGTLAYNVRGFVQ